MFDLRQLRELASHLLRFDAVTFLAFLDNLRVTEGAQSVWLMHSSAHIVFEAAKVGDTPISCARFWVFPGTGTADGNARSYSVWRLKSL